MLRGNAKLKLDSDLQRLQEDTGWKLVVLTSYGEGTVPPLRALEQYWKADSKTIIVSSTEEQEWMQNVTGQIVEVDFALVP